MFWLVRSACIANVGRVISLAALSANRVRQEDTYANKGEICSSTKLVHCKKNILGITLFYSFAVGPLKMGLKVENNLFFLIWALPNWSEN